MKIKKKIPQTEQEKRDCYFEAYGKQYDDPKRKQHPLPIDIACAVAMRVLEKDKNYDYCL